MHPIHPKNSTNLAEKTTNIPPIFTDQPSLIHPQAAALQNHGASQMPHRSVEALSSQEQSDQLWKSMAQQNFWGVSGRMSWAEKIVDVKSKDDTLWEIIEAATQDAAYNKDAIKRAIEALSTQEKRERAWMSVAQSPYLTAHERIDAVQCLPDVDARDLILMQMLEGKNQKKFSAGTIAVINALSTQEKRNAVSMPIAQNKKLPIFQRIRVAELLSINSTKDAVLLAIIEDIIKDSYDHDDITAAIQALSTEKMRDKAWMSVVLNSDLSMNDRRQALMHLSDLAIRDAILLREIERTNSESAFCYKQSSYCYKESSYSYIAYTEAAIQSLRQRSDEAANAVRDRRLIAMLEEASKK